MIIDSHTHIGGWDGEKVVATDASDNLKKLLREMKSANVDHALILASHRRQCPHEPDTATVLRAVGKNRQVSVVGSVDVLNRRDKDLSEMDELLSAGKIVAIKLYPGYQHFYPNDPACEPIYRLCLKHGVPVIFHTGDTLSGVTEVAKVKYSHPLAIDDVAADYPDLKIVIAHMGNPWFTDCAEVLYKNDNVYADTSGLFLSQDGILTNSAYGRLMKRRVQELMAYCTPRKLLFGTDWALARMKAYLKFVSALGIGQRDLEYVLHRNAAAVFNLGK